MPATLTQHQRLAASTYPRRTSALRTLARGLKHAADAAGEALMRWAVAYEAVAQQRIMRELALSHPSLVREIRAARSAAAAEAARRSPVIGMWE